MPTRPHTTPAARVYAQAFLEAVGPERRDALGTALDEFLHAVESTPDLRRFLETPALDGATKQKVLESLRGSVDDTLLDFLCVVAGKQRSELLGEIGAAYHELADRAAGRVRAVIRTAAPLAPELRQLVHEGMQRRLGREVVLATEVDPNLIAGLVVQVEDKVFEGSVHGWLERMRKEMVRSSGYED